MRHSQDTDFGSALSPREVGGRAVCNRLDARSVMNIKLWFITSLVALMAIAPLTEGAKTKVTKRKTESRNKDKGLSQKEKAQRDFDSLREIGQSIELPDKVESLTDDMASLDQQVTLAETQKKRIAQMRTIRDKTLTSWDKVNRKKFDAMKARLDKFSTPRDLRACKTVVTQMQSMSKTRAGIVISNERKIFGILTAEQKGKWNTPILSKILLDEFASIELSKEQTGKIESAVSAQGKRLSVPLGSGPPPVQVTEPIKKYVYTRILTAKQRKEYVASKRQEKVGGKSR